MRQEIARQFLVHPFSAMRKVRRDDARAIDDRLSPAKFGHHLHNARAAEVMVITLDASVGAVEQRDVERDAIAKLIERRRGVDAGVVTIEDRLASATNP